MVTSARRWKSSKVSQVSPSFHPSSKPSHLPECRSTWSPSWFFSGSSPSVSPAPCPCSVSPWLITGINAIIFHITNTFLTYLLEGQNIHLQQIIIFTWSKTSTSSVRAWRGSSKAFWSGSTTSTTSGGVSVIWKYCRGKCYPVFYCLKYSLLLYASVFCNLIQTCLGVT